MITCRASARGYTNLDLSQPERANGSPDSRKRYRGFAVPLSCSVAPATEQFLDQNQSVGLSVDRSVLQARGFDHIGLTPAAISRTATTATYLARMGGEEDNGWDGVAAALGVS